MTTGKHAVIIEDNTLNSYVLQLMLNLHHISSSVVASPLLLDEVLQELHTPVDIIFLDLELPVKSGFELLTELRANPSLQQVPIVAYSVHTSELHAAREAGFHSFLGKPLNVRNFPHQLNRILKGQPVWEV